MRFHPLLLLLVAALCSTTTTVSAQSDIACPDIGEEADCETCLEAGCVLAVGVCMINCSFIADAPCWDMQYYNNTSVVDVCARKEQQETDTDICGSPAITNCTSCTSTVKSDGISMCEWYSLGGGDGYCGTGGCDMVACGVETCEDMAVSAPPLGNETFDFYCASAAPDADCNTCLEAGCVHAVGECYQDCSVIADVACWDLQSPGNTNKTVEQVCTMATEREADDQICSGIVDDCGTCTSTLKSDGVSTCEWYSFGDDGGSCGSGGCDMMGICGLATCDSSSNTTTMMEPPIMEDAGPCGGFEYCEPCLNSRIECAWIGGICTHSCDDVADATCYHPAEFDGAAGPDICAVAIEAGEAEPVPEEGGPCGGFEYCEPCLNSRIECAWIGGICTQSCGDVPFAVCYHPAEFDGAAGPDICDIAILAGHAEPVPKEQVEPEEEDGPCNGFDACEPCLNSRIDCAWIGGACEQNCDAVADATCYHPSEFDGMAGPEICAIAADDALEDEGGESVSVTRDGPQTLESGALRIVRRTTIIGIMAVALAAVAL